MATTQTTPVPGGADEVYHPLGLALGSVRAMMSLLICGFFWLILLWPTDGLVKPMLGHFFLLSLVLMAFASAPTRDDERSEWLPWVLRLLFAGGSVAVVAFVLVQDPTRLQTRLTPDPAEFHQWWGPYLAITAGGFAAGLFLRYALGRDSYLFQTLRGWVAVIGLILLALEIGLVLVMLSSENKPFEFAQYWEAASLAVVSAYFGTRA